MTKKAFATIVVEAMERRGISAMDLHRMSGVSYDVINKLKHRPESSTKAENARRLAAALDLEWSDGDNSVDNKNEIQMVDVYDVSASAGHGQIVDSEYVIDRLSFPPDYLARLTRTDPRHLKIIGVKGDSMEPTLKDDDVVMLDTSKTSLDFDGLFVLRWGDALHVKRIGRGSNGSVRIISDNRDAYPAIEMQRAEIEVVGKVIWMGKKV
ncbi:S24 family peptidase [Paenirhodobacter sp. CAU 1674]|uniref:S24 family peptidase n=1 Tax=Paenirhodobacter sp. CAU 1674 TaxID=3032596 RepID=UPI0023D9D91B|nr:S24 family peptidase [Paenirhodobacter sp. CAU 1674]MDF2140836.1 S24 family peptidase [Paenirhodobacter sp. CAU 1674]